MNKLIVVCVVLFAAFLMFGCTSPSMAIADSVVITIVDINGFTHNIVLDDLNDVDVAGVLPGQILLWDGAAWVPGDMNIIGSITDTNWQTSWTVFDANMKSTYALILHDHNGFYPLKADVNVWTNQLLTPYLLKADANGFFTLKADTNIWITQKLVPYLLGVDANLFYVLKSDVNLWIGQLDTNWQTSWATLDANLKATYLTSYIDSNWQTSWSLLDANLKATYSKTDTNVYTLCGDNNQFALGSGYCIPYDAGSTYKPTSVLKVYGTDFNNVDLGAIKEYDGNYYTIREGSGANPLQIDVNYTGVVSFNSIIVKERYSGGSGHDMLVQIYKYTTGTWEEYFEITDQTNPEVLYIPVLDSTDHASGGLTQLRFTHPDNGITSHYFYVDFVWLVNGTTMGTTNQHDALSGRENQSNHPWALSKVDGNVLYLTPVDGNAWYLPLSTVLPQTKAAVTNLFLKDYNAITGTFTATQPIFSDIGGWPATCPANKFIYRIATGTIYCDTPIDTNWENTWAAFDANIRATYKLPWSDTNWQTSWSVLDVNLRATYMLLGAVTDSNWQTSWTAFDANMKGTYRRYTVDLNTSERVQADKNFLIGSKGYMYDDGNSIIIGRAA